jgi:hypothetical protein
MNNPSARVSRSRFQISRSCFWLSLNLDFDSNPILIMKNLKTPYLTGWNWKLFSSEIVLKINNISSNCSLCTRASQFPMHVELVNYITRELSKVIYLIKNINFIHNLCHCSIFTPILKLWLIINLSAIPLFECSFAPFVNVPFIPCLSHKSTTCGKLKRNRWDYIL